MNRPDYPDLALERARTANPSSTRLRYSLASLYDVQLISGLLSLSAPLMNRSAAQHSHSTNIAKATAYTHVVASIPFSNSRRQAQVSYDTITSLHLPTYLPTSLIHATTTRKPHTHPSGSYRISLTPRPPFSPLPSLSSPPLI